MKDYIPFIDSYNALYDAACKLPSNDDKDYIRFYICLASFIAEIVFIEYKLGYKIAFKSTREVATLLKLAKLRKLIGDKGYALILSIIHWKVRNLIGESWEDFKKFLRNIGMRFDQSTKKSNLATFIRETSHELEM